MNSPPLITAFEHCNRAGAWAREWEKYKIDSIEMLQRAIREGLTTARQDYGECAGESCYGMGIEPGLETKQMDIHSEVCHLSCLADILTTAIRKPTDKPWGVVEPVRIDDGPLWTSDAYLDPSGSFLRRIVLASNWNDDRHYSECRAWDSIGNVCAYGLPMQMAVCVIGQNRNGKRHSYWSHGLRHPVSRKLRFRKRTDKSVPFKDSWKECWREDYDEISTKEWLQAMHEDGVLADSCFVIEVPVPAKAARQKVLDIAARKLDKLYKLKTLPDEQFTNCSWPQKCAYIRPCHNGDLPSGKYGFVKVESLTS